MQVNGCKFGRWSLFWFTNDLVPKAESPASEQQALVLKREDRASACAEKNTASDIFCNNRYLFQGGTPQLASILTGSVIISATIDAG